MDDREMALEHERELGALYDQAEVSPLPMAEGALYEALERVVRAWTQTGRPGSELAAALDLERSALRRRWPDLSRALDGLARAAGRGPS